MKGKDATGSGYSLREATIASSHILLPHVFISGEFMEIPCPRTSFSHNFGYTCFFVNDAKLSFYVIKGKMCKAVLPSSLLSCLVCHKHKYLVHMFTTNQALGFL